VRNNFEKISRNNNCTSLFFFYDSSRAARSAVHHINCFVSLCLSAPLSISTFLSRLRHSPTKEQNQHNATAEDGGGELFLFGCIHMFKMA
jgi:hypothetical protein